MNVQEYILSIIDPYDLICTVQDFGSVSRFSALMLPIMRSRKTVMETRETIRVTLLLSQNSLG